jgi:cytochrome bd-type quinol oxidase subunit 2
MVQRIWHAAEAARLAQWAALAAGVGGVMVFGSVVAGVGEWVEGRQLDTVAGWAIPALLLAVTAAAVAIRAVHTGEGRRVTLVLGLAVGTSMLVLIVVNPSIAPPVP